jgi:hypothetical protein
VSKSKKSPRARVKRDIHMAEKHGVTPSKLAKIQSKIDWLCNKGKVEEVEARSWKRRIMMATVRPEPVLIPTRPGSKLPERRKHDRGEEQSSRPKSVAGVLEIAKMRGSHG